MFDTAAEPPPPATPPTPPIADPADPAGGLAGVPTARLEADICTLAGHLAAATCRWLLLLAEFDRREAWATWGARSAAQWLSWRCGMGGGTAREHLRVGRALQDLPAARAAFTAGTLTYSKVRAITRIATPALDAELTNLALGTTAAQVDRIVNEYRRAEHREHPPLPTPSTLTRRWDDNGILTVTLRLHPDDGALLIGALDAYGDALTAEQNTQHRGTPPDEPEPEPGEPEPGEDCPPLDTPPRTGRGPAADAEALLAIITTAMATGPTDTSGADHYDVVLHADIDQLHPDNDTPAGTPNPEPADTLRHGRCHLRGGPAVHPDTLRRMTCDARIRIMTHGPDGTPKDVSRRHRLVTPALRTLLEERDHGRCAFPTCRSRRRLHAHHVIHWADSGPTNLDNLILLCPFHHQLVHEHGYTVNTPTAATFTFHRPDGTTINPAPPLTGNPDLTGHHNATITDDTTTPEWWADPLHLADTIDGLLRERDRKAAAAAAAATSTNLAA